MSFNLGRDAVRYTHVHAGLLILIVHIRRPTYSHAPIPPQVYILFYMYTQTKLRTAEAYA